MDKKAILPSGLSLSSQIGRSLATLREKFWYKFEFPYMLYILKLLPQFKVQQNLCKMAPKNRHNKDLNDKWKLSEGRKYCRMLPLVDHQACSLLQYINVIANLFIMGNHFNELR